MILLDFHGFVVNSNQLPKFLALLGKSIHCSGDHLFDDLCLKAPANAYLSACASGLKQINGISLRMVINIGHKLGFRP